MADVVKQGWLIKSPPPGVMKAWKRRYFRFRKATSSGKARLEYFVDSKNLEKAVPKGIINLHDCTAVEDGEQDPSKMKYVFKIVTSSRTYQLSASTKLELDEWKGAICAEIFSPAAPAAVAPSAPAPFAAGASPNGFETQSSLRASQRPRNALSPPDAAPPPRTSFSQPRRVPSHLQSGGFGASNDAAAREFRERRSKHPKPVGPQPWQYAQISREESETILTDYGLANGLFLVRESASKRGAHAVSMCCNQKIVHHLVTVTGAGTYELNGNTCGNCRSLSEVIQFLQTVHGPPLNWRNPLKTWPLALDGGGSANAFASPAPPQLASRVPVPVPASSSAASQDQRLFQAEILFSPESQSLGYSGATTSCLLKVSAASIVLVDDESQGEVAVWPLSAIDRHGSTPDTFFFHAGSPAPHQGTFTFKTFLGSDIANIIKPFVPPAPVGRPQPMPRAASVRVPLASEPVSPVTVNTFQSVRERPKPQPVSSLGVDASPVPAPRPASVRRSPTDGAPPIVPRQGSNIGAISEAPEHSSEDENYEVPEEDKQHGGKPRPPPVMPKRNSGGVAGVDEDHVNKMRSLLRQQGEALLKGQLPVASRPDAGQKAPANDTADFFADIDKAAEDIQNVVRSIGVSAMPSLDTIMNVKAGLKKAAPPVPKKSEAVAQQPPPVLSPKPSLNKMELGGDEPPIPPKPALSPVEPPLPPKPASYMNTEIAPPALPAKPASLVANEGLYNQEGVEEHHGAPAADHEVDEESSGEEDAAAAVVAAAAAAPTSSAASGELWLAGCDYESASPDKLCFEEGDAITVLIKDNAGWWYARRGDREGWVPSDFLDPYPPADEAEASASSSNPPLQPALDPNSPEALIAEALAAVSNADQTLQRIASFSQPPLPPKPAAVGGGGGGGDVPAPVPPPKRVSGDAAPPPVLPPKNDKARPAASESANSSTTNPAAPSPAVPQTLPEGAQPASPPALPPRPSAADTEASTPLPPIVPRKSQALLIPEDPSAPPVPRKGVYEQRPPPPALPTTSTTTTTTTTTTSTDTQEDAAPPLAPRPASSSQPEREEAASPPPRVPLRMPETPRAGEGGKSHYDTVAKNTEEEGEEEELYADMSDANPVRIVAKERTGSFYEQMQYRGDGLSMDVPDEERERETVYHVPRDISNEDISKRASLISLTSTSSSSSLSERAPPVPEKTSRPVSVRPESLPEEGGEYMDVESRDDQQSVYESLSSALSPPSSLPSRAAPPAVKPYDRVVSSVMDGVTVASSSTDIASSGGSLVRQQSKTKIREMSNANRISVMSRVRTGELTVDAACSLVEDWEAGLIDDVSTA